MPFNSQTFVTNIHTKETFHNFFPPVLLTPALLQKPLDNCKSVYVCISYLNWSIIPLLPVKTHLLGIKGFIWNVT